MTSPNTPRPELGGRTPEHWARNEQACEWILILGGLCGMFATGFFAGQILVALIFG